MKKEPEELPDQLIPRIQTIYAEFWVTAPKNLRNFIPSMQERIKMTQKTPEEAREFIDRAFERWGDDAEKIIKGSKQSFLETTKYSFLAYLKTLVSIADAEGVINVALGEQMLKEEMGDYYSNEKLETAVWFLQSDRDWNAISHK